MPYNDIPWISYEKLKKRSQTMRPYANTTDTFPIGAREYSHRHFRTNNDGVFDIYLGNRQVVDAGLSGTRTERSNEQSAKDYAVRAYVARVHPDNSFEFMTPRGGYSTLMFYNNLIERASICQNVKHGGATMYFNGDLHFRRDDLHPARSNAHPLFYGLRINLGDFSVHPTTDYVTYLPILKRKESQEFMSQFDDFYKSWRILLGNIHPNTFPEIMNDLVNEYPDVLNWCKESEPNVSCTWAVLTSTIIDLVSKKRYADAALLCTGYKTPWNLHRIYEMRDKHYVATHMYRHTVAAVFQAVDNSKHYLQRSTPSLFKYRQLGAGEPLPSSKWGFRTVLLSTNEIVVRM